MITEDPSAGTVGEPPGKDLAAFAGEILRLVRRHGDVSQREQFALAVAFIVRTSKTIKIFNGPIVVSSEQRDRARWAKKVLPRLDRLQAVLLEDLPPGANVRGELLVELAHLSEMLARAEFSAVSQTGRGRPTGLSKPPEGAKGMAWRIAGEWLRVFGSPPGIENSPVFKVVTKALKQSGLKATEAQVKGALKAWRKYQPDPGYVAPMKAINIISVDKIPEK